MTVYQWDSAPCGYHSSPVAADNRPDREQLDAIIAANSGRQQCPRSWLLRPG